mmetsp:Transcript_45120/g.125515  ORF Transcript_45120/g.125515 Transcript_45120/m.125515 type:complete len:201 (+) Transcript_45120:120-722(+)
MPSRHWEPLPRRHPPAGVHRAGMSSLSPGVAPPAAPPGPALKRSPRRARFACSSSSGAVAAPAPNTSTAPRERPAPPRRRFRGLDAGSSRLPPREPPPCQWLFRSSCCQPPRLRHHWESWRCQAPCVPQLRPPSHHLPPVQASSSHLRFTRETVFAWEPPSSCFVRISLSCLAICSRMSMASSSLTTACPTLRRFPDGMP